MAVKKDERRKKKENPCASKEREDKSVTLKMAGNFLWKNWSGNNLRPMKFIGLAVPAQ